MSANGTEYMTQKRNDVSVKLDAGAYRKLRTVASWKGMHVAEYLTEIVETVTTRELAKMAKEVGKAKSQEEDE